MNKFRIKSTIQNLEASKQFHSENKMRLLKQRDFKGYTRNEKMQDEKNLSIKIMREML